MYYAKLLLLGYNIEREMAKDEARHGRGFQGLYDRFFK